jgi:hypothetical protein
MIGTNVEDAIFPALIKRIEKRCTAAHGSFYISGLTVARPLLVAATAIVPSLSLNTGET